MNSLEEEHSKANDTKHVVTCFPLTMGPQDIRQHSDRRHKTFPKGQNASECIHFESYHLVVQFSSVLSLSCV